jgi:hypothetical protein
VTHPIRTVVSPALALCVLAGSRAAGQCEWRLGPAQSGALDGNIKAATLWDPDGAGPLPARLVVGGNLLTRAGLSAASNIAVYDGASWMPMGAGIGQSTVEAVATFNNELIAAGGFTSAGGQPVSNIARWNGTSWSGLGVGVSGSSGLVSTLAVYNGSLYAGGSFFSAGGVPANRIARWDGANWSALGVGLDDIPRAMTVLAGTLYVGGDFHTAGGTTVHGLAAWTGSAWQAVGPGVTGEVYSLAGRQTAAGATRLYVGGVFSSAGGIAANNIVAIDSPGIVPSYGALGSGIPGVVETIVVRALGASNSEVTAAAWSSSSGPAVWRLSGTSWNLLGSIPPSPDLGDLVFFNNQYVAGLYPDPVNVRFWDTAAGLWAPLGPGIHGTINATVPFGTDLIVAGSFDYAGNVRLSNIGIWNGTTWTPMAGGMNGPVNALLVSQGALYAAGHFTSTGSGPANNIAMWNGAGWDPVGPATGSPGTILAMTEYNGQLLIGGQFNGAAVQAWDGATWTPMANGLRTVTPTGLNHPDAFAIGPDGTLYVGGSYVIESNGSYALARYTGAQWVPVPGLANESIVTSFGASGATLYAGGNGLGVATVSGEPREFEIATVTPAAATPDPSVYIVGNAIPGPGSISSFATYNGSLYAAGNFDHAPNATGAGLLRLSGGAWTPVGNGTASTDFGHAMSVYQNELVVAGDLTVAGNQYGHAWARWFCPPTCYANCDQSTQPPVLNVADFACFLQKYAGSDPYANCDASTTPPVLNVNDFSCFLQRYAAGCP